MSVERQRQTANGWGMLVVLIVATLALVGCLILSVRTMADHRGEPEMAMVVQTIATVLGLVAAAVLWGGFFTLQPNEGAVLLLFGAYKGTSRHEGLQWANPFYKKMKISLRARNLNGDKLKVNDQRGNPIEIAAVVVWRVKDTAQAVFDVDKYENYVSIQSESAVRHLASRYAYDSAADHERSLRGSMDEVSLDLQQELQERLSKAGVFVEEARLSHLAYAPEIAGVMLRRQQAEAVVAARTRIVEGAVGMVEMALQHLEQHKTVELDDERKAAMVSNLLVVLCGEQAAHPVVNAGTLYT
jgi:hypothetical protein